MLVGKLSALTVSPFQSNPSLGGLKVKLFSDKKNALPHEQQSYRLSFPKKHLYLHELTSVLV